VSAHITEPNSDLKTTSSVSKCLRKKLPLTVWKYLSVEGNKNLILGIITQISDGRHLYFSYSIEQKTPLGNIGSGDAEGYSFLICCCISFMFV